jgi:hypothetical protein
MGGYTESKYIKKRHDSIIKEFGDIEGVKELVDTIKGIYGSEIYEKFSNVYIFNDKHRDYKNQISLKDSKKVKIIRLANENMSRSIFSFPILSDLLGFLDFYRMYTFFIDVYEMNVGRKMDYSEKEKLYYSKLDERLTFALDKFNEVTETPEPTAEYFRKLGKVKWKDKKTKEFHKKLNRFRSEINRVKWGLIGSGSVSVSEGKLILFLSGCNAVNNGRNKINMQDIIIAYKTYFKLLKTDFPSLVDRLWEENKFKVEISE